MEWFQDAGRLRAMRYRDIIAGYHHLPSFDVGVAPAPSGRVSVLVPALNEAAYVADACRSLALQTLRRDHPDKVEIVLVDSGSRDATRERARPFVDRIVSAPRGKLSALAAGVRKAKGDLVLEADADGWYPPGWAARMVAPFAQPGVVAVRGDFVYYDSPVLRPLWRVRRPTFRALGNFPGGVRAYTRDAFDRAGGFDESVDQKGFWDVWPEEEFRFRSRLLRWGRLADAPDAVCFKSARRGDPLFVRDDRVAGFRGALDGRFRDGFTDALFRLRQGPRGVAALRR